jgi:hypothetical protein
MASSLPTRSSARTAADHTPGMIDAELPHLLGTGFPEPGTQRVCSGLGRPTHRASVYQAIA